MSNSSNSQQPETNLPQTDSSETLSTEPISHSPVPSENQETSPIAKFPAPSSSQQSNRYVGSGSFQFPIDVVRKLLALLDWKTFFAFLRVSHAFRNVGREGLFLPSTGHVDIQNEAISRFCAVIQKEQEVYFIPRVVLFESTDIIQHDDISVHILTNVDEQTVPEDAIVSMMIQIHTPTKALQILQYLEQIVTKEGFKNLKHLMLLDFPGCPTLEHWIRYLGLSTLCLRFSESDHIGCAGDGMDKLESLYITLPCKGSGLISFSVFQLKEVVVYCPESNESTVAEKPICLNFERCSSLKIVEIHGHPGCKPKCSLKFEKYWRKMEKLIWNLPFTTDGHCILDGELEDFKEIYVQCTSCKLVEEPSRPNNNSLKRPSLLPRSKLRRFLTTTFVHVEDALTLVNYPNKTLPLQ